MSETPPSRHQPPAPVLRPHTYDGIQEFDQHLPNWWLFTLYIMVVFTVIYWLVRYQLGVRPDDGERVEAKIAAHRMITSAMFASQGSGDDVKLWQASRDPAVKGRGQEIFDTVCHACHAKDLSAKIGPVPLPGLPLNDAEWKYGGKPTEILKIVRSGSPDISKGMVAWEPQLGRQKVLDVVAYILSYHQPPEGVLVDEEK